jgi:hypothetical protein
MTQLSTQEFRHPRNAARIVLARPGLTVGTQIMTLTGERAIEEIGVGDRILTKDFGVQTLKSISFHDCDLTQDPDARPVCIPPDAFGSDRDAGALYLAPHQKLALRHRMFDLFFGVREVVVEARHLVGHCGITRTEDLRGVTYVALGFAQQHLIYCSNFAVDLSSDPKKPCRTSLSREQAKLACSLYQTHMYQNSSSGLPLH